MNAYLFESERLGFRDWITEDLDLMATLNADPEVMKYFPSTQSKKKTLAFIERMMELYRKRGHCYFAVETKKDKKIIGFIGLGRQTFESDFTPCVDIGWRLAKEFWGKGYATEGAKRCLEYGFQELGFSEIFSIASKANTKSINVMKKIGMKLDSEFIHPVLIDYPHLKDCVCYRLKS